MMYAGRILPFITVVVMASGMQPFKEQNSSHDKNVSNQNYLEYSSNLKSILASLKCYTKRLVAEFGRLSSKDKSSKLSCYINQVSKIKDESLNNGEKIWNVYLSKEGYGIPLEYRDMVKEEYENFKYSVVKHTMIGIAKLSFRSRGGNPNKCLC